MINAIDKQFVQAVEKAHFRTQADTGANLNALMIWNMVRAHVGLDPIRREDLPTFCETHDTLHPLKEDYGCKARYPVAE